MIIVNINDKWDTKASISCLPFNLISNAFEFFLLITEIRLTIYLKLFKAQVAVKLDENLIRLY